MTLQQVHTKIKELKGAGNNVPLDAVLASFESIGDLTPHLHQLTYLKLIEINHRERIVHLTLHGLLTTIP